MNPGLAMVDSTWTVAEISLYGCDFVLQYRMLKTIIISCR